MTVGFTKLRFNEFAKSAAVCGAVALSGTAVMATPVNIGSGTGRLTVNAGNAVWFLNNNITFSTTSSNWGFSEANLHTGAGTRNDAFDGALSWHVNASPPGSLSNGGYRSPNGTIDITPYPIVSSVGTTVTGAAQTMVGLTVTGQIYFSPVKAVARSMLILQNPTGAPITATVDVVSNLGSDANTRYQATSSGDTAYDPTDNWVVTSETATPTTANDPILTYAFTQTGASVRPTVLSGFTNGSDRQFLRYTVTVPAGQTQRLMAFMQMSGTVANATADAPLFSTNAALQGTDYLAGMSATDQSQVVNWALQPVVVTPTDPIPPLAAQPPTPGIGSQPGVLDLASGKGPDMMQCLMATVNNLFGVTAQYLGQGTDGVAKISLGGGRTIAFYPVHASTDASQSADLHLTDSNVLNVGTSCGNFNVIPALNNLIDFGTIINAMGQRLDTSAQGIFTFVMGNQTFVGRPDYLVATGGSPTTPRLVLGSDGVYRFTDSTGNVQIIRPAFLDTAGLISQVRSALSLGGWLSIQTDGTALFTTYDGRKFVLTPDMALTPAPAANAAQLWWQDGPNHYLFRSSLLTMAQGFSVRQL